MKRVNLRLDVTKDERDLIRKAAALAGYRSMAEFCRTVVLREATAHTDPKPSPAAATTMEDERWKAQR
jgi:uncharacterized protein (DUF1778 family)